VNQLGLQSIHTWKQHKETPCIAYLSKTSKNILFLVFIFYVFSSTKLENRRVEQVLPMDRGGSLGVGM
jgi:hypothetical protein